MAKKTAPSAFIPCNRDVMQNVVQSRRGPSVPVDSSQVSSVCIYEGTILSLTLLSA